MVDVLNVVAAVLFAEAAAVVLEGSAVDVAFASACGSSDELLSFSMASLSF